MKLLCAEDQGLREVLKKNRRKARFLPLLVFTLDLSLYIASTCAALAAADPVVACIWGTAAGVAIGMLFVVGHDACHGSLTPARALNSWIGRLAFLPSLTPFRAWEIAHNQRHHVYTNLKPLDYVWAPLSKPEYDQLPPGRRILERVYRTVPGVGLYYVLEIWWRRLICDGLKAKRARVDIAVCAIYAFILFAAGIRSGVLSLFAGVGLPFLVWNWMMGWAVFQHHTHPDVQWFDDLEVWQSSRPQLRCTVRVVLPGIVDAILHNIMNHTAHHLDVTIPLYRLPAAQTALESATENFIVRYRWTPRTFLRHLRACKLYDFESRRWLDFDGRPTA